MSPSPANRVLSTYELLESILFNLDMKDLLNFQRVSKSFRSVIDRSNKIQQKLFFQPISHKGETETAVKFNTFALRALRTPTLLFFDHSRILGFYKFFSPKLEVAAPLNTIIEGSWRNMLLRQPSCDWISLAVESESFDARLHDETDWYYFNREEQRLGSIVDAIKDTTDSSRFRTVSDEGKQRSLEADAV